MVNLLDICQRKKLIILPACYIPQALLRSEAFLAYPKCGFGLLDVYLLNYVIRVIKFILLVCLFVCTFATKEQQASAS